MNFIRKPDILSRNIKLCNAVLKYNCNRRLTLPIASFPNYVNTRNYSDGNVEIPKVPRLMDFPPIVWPSFFKFIKNWMFANFIIRPYFEQEFSLVQFVEASKHAVEVVSTAIQAGQFDKLDGLIVPEAIREIKTAVSKLSVQQRQALAINKEDIFYAFPYQVGVMFDDSDKRWVEITMCYHVLRGLKEMRENGEVPPLSMGFSPEYQEQLYILNYRFIREYTKGVDDSWWINIVNHFQPHNIMK